MPQDIKEMNEKYLGKQMLLDEGKNMIKSEEDRIIVVKHDCPKILPPNRASNPFH